MKNSTLTYSEIYYSRGKSETTIQTDGGTEFTNEYISYRHKPTAFQTELRSWGIAHTVNPPASPTYNSDVESSHRLIEDELYANLWQYYRREFLHAASTYQRFFNLVRYNSYKQGTPAQLFNDKDTSINPDVLTFTPRIVDLYLAHPYRLKEVS